MDYEICPLTVEIKIDSAHLCEIEAGVEINLHCKAIPRSGSDAGAAAEYTIENCWVNCRRYHPAGPLTARWTDEWKPCPQAFESYVREYAASTEGQWDIEDWIAENL